MVSREQERFFCSPSRPLERAAFFVRIGTYSVRDSVVQSYPQRSGILPNIYTDLKLRTNEWRRVAALSIEAMEDAKRSLISLRATIDHSYALVRQTHRELERVRKMKSGMIAL
jgi:hypothetical protein